MSLKIYVCSGSSEAETAAYYVAKLRKSGCEITLDWSAEVLKLRAAGNADKNNRVDHVLSDDERRTAKLADIDAVISADYVWHIVPSKASFGSGYEMAIADMNGVDTIVSGESKQSLFLVDACYTFATNDEAFDFIVKENERLIAMQPPTFTKTQLRDAIACMFEMNQESGVPVQGAIEMMTSWVAGHLKNRAQVTDA